MFEFIWNIASTGGLVIAGYWLRGKVNGGSTNKDLVRR